MPTTVYLINIINIFYKFSNIILLVPYLHVRRTFSYFKDLTPT